MTSSRPSGWRWGNVPVPEPLVGGLFAGAVLHFIRPWPLAPGGRLRWAVGGALLLVSLGIVAWAVVTVGRQAIDSPSSLVTEGPYRYGRNPMYVGWSGLYLGIAVVANIAWPLVLFPLVAIVVHAVVRREEQALERQFGADYRAYRHRVRRYL